MKKQAFLQGLLGFPVGIAIGYVVTIIISLVSGQGQYQAVVPSLVATVGSEIGAVTLQAALCGLIGFSFSAASVIWQIENWSIARQSGTYFLITALTMLPIAYLAGWMEHTLTGFLMYFGIFVAVFLVVWVIQYFIWKQKINKFNAKISNK